MMANHRHDLGKSKSMRLFNQLKQSPDQVPQSKWERAHTESQRALLVSPGFQQFRDHTASTWAPDRTRCSHPGMALVGDRYGQDGKQHNHFPLGGHQVNQPRYSEEDQGSSLFVELPSSPSSEAIITPDGYRKQTALDSRTLEHAHTDETAGHLPHQPDMASPKFSAWISVEPVIEPDVKTDDNSEKGSTDSLATVNARTMSMGSEDSFGCRSRVIRQSLWFA